MRYAAFSRCYRKTLENTLIRSIRATHVRLSRAPSSKPQRVPARMTSSKDRRPLLGAPTSFRGCREPRPPHILFDPRSILISFNVSEVSFLIFSLFVDCFMSVFSGLNPLVGSRRSAGCCRWWTMQASPREASASASSRSRRCWASLRTGLNY